MLQCKGNTEDKSVIKLLPNEKRYGLRRKFARNSTKEVVDKLGQDINQKVNDGSLARTTQVE